MIIWGKRLKPCADGQCPKYKFTCDNTMMQLCIFKIQSCLTVNYPCNHNYNAHFQRDIKKSVFVGNMPFGKSRSITLKFAAQMNNAFSKRPLLQELGNICLDPFQKFCLVLHKTETVSCHNLMIIIPSAS